jgi:hypothetical protein
MFAVAHDAARPFIVTAGDTAVRAIGTRFEVYQRPGRVVRVTLAEGRVRVRGRQAGGPDAGPAPVILTAGERVEIVAAPSPAAPGGGRRGRRHRLDQRAADLQGHRAWPTRWPRSTATAARRVVLGPGRPGRRAGQRRSSTPATPKPSSTVSKLLDRERCADLKWTDHLNSSARTAPAWAETSTRPAHTAAAGSDALTS